MPDDVRQRLLEDPIRREGDARGSAAWMPSTVTWTGRPESRACSTRRSSWSRPGLRREGRRALVGAQHAEEPPHLCHRLACGRLHTAQVVGLPRELRRQPPANRLGLDGDDADRVRDDVVELAGDATPLLGDSRGRLALALALGEKYELVCLTDALANQATDPPRAAEEEAESDDVTRRGLASGGERGKERDSGGGHEVCQPAFDGGAHRVARENDGAEQGQRRIGIEHDETCDRTYERERWDATANGEGREEERGEERMRPRTAGGEAERRLQLGGCDERPGDRGVDEELALRQNLHNADGSSVLQARASAVRPISTARRSADWPSAIAPRRR